MKDDDAERISLAIHHVIEVLPPTIEIDARGLARWLQSEFPGRSVAELVAHVERHCGAFGRVCR